MVGVGGCDQPGDDSKHHQHTAQRCPRNLNNKGYLLWLSGEIVKHKKKGGNCEPDGRNDGIKERDYRVEIAGVCEDCHHRWYEQDEGKVAHCRQLPIPNSIPGRSKNEPGKYSDHGAFHW